MTLVQYDRVQETSTTTGTGTYTLAGAVLGYQSFAAVGDGNTCYYCAMGVDGNGNPNGDGWEVGLGTYTAAGTTLARTAVLASTNGGAAVNWAAGTRRIFVTIPAGGAPPLSLTNATGLPLTAGAGVTGILPGANGGGLVRLAQVITAGSQTTVDFSSISALYQALVIHWIAQNSGAGTTDVAMHLKINNDGTSGNYTSAGRTGILNGSASNANVGATAAGGAVGTLAQSGTSGSASGGEIIIPGYAQTTFHKRVVGKHAEDTTTAGIFVATSGFRWKSTVAINQLTFAASDGTAFTDGSIFTLYGAN